MKKVNKELFEALESAKKIYNNDLKEMLEVKLFKGYSFKREILNNLKLDLFVELFINGYELEETSEEKILRVYNSASYDEFGKGFDKGVEFTLNALGIKIKGINS